MNPATSYAHCDPFEKADQAWDAIESDDAKVKAMCAKVIAEQYPFIKTPADYAFAQYRGIIGSIDTQVRELIAREAEATKLRRVK